MKRFLGVVIVSAVVSVLTVFGVLRTDMVSRQPAATNVPEAGKIDNEQIESVVSNYILKNPEIVLLALTKLQEKEENANKAKRKEAISNNRKILDDERYPVIGNGKYPIYHFYDYNCGYCKIFSEVVLKLAEENKDIRIIMHDTPIFGDDSSYAAKVGLFANSKGKYKEFYKKMMKMKGKANAESATRVIKEIGLNVTEMKKFVKADKTAEDLLIKTKDLAVLLGISSMPTTLVDDELFLGAAGYDKMKELTDKYIEKASETVSSEEKDSAAKKD